MKKALPWLAAAAAVLLGAGDGVGYVRSIVDSRQNPDPHCLWWPAGTITFNQGSQGAPDTPDARGAVTRGWNTWETQLARCSNLTFAEAANVSSRSIGFSAGVMDTNANVILFRTRKCDDLVPFGDACLKDATCDNKYDCWPSDYEPETIALTTNTYDVTTGRMYDSDMELNAANFYFTTVDSPVCPNGVKNQACVAFDVQNTVTHEFGHVLGLAHSTDPRSTMYASAPAGQTSKRNLDDGSLAFACETYPQGAPSRDCIIDQAHSALGKAQGCSSSGGEASGFALMAALIFVGRWAGRQRTVS